VGVQCPHQAYNAPFSVRIGNGTGGGGIWDR
jgi:hypothetical protein